VAGTKRIGLKLEFYLRGKNKIPSVSFEGVGDFGVPMTAYKDKEQDKVFAKFSMAAHKFCAEMKKAGEFKSA
jgi:hypothetical protein